MKISKRPTLPPDTGRSRDSHNSDRHQSRFSHPRGDFEIPFDEPGAKRVRRSTTGDDETQRNRVVTTSLEKKQWAAPQPVGIDPMTNLGDVYIKFIDVAGGTKAINRLDGRYFNSQVEGGVTRCVRT
ncbi:hypothetical protein BU16DRAFT_554062 [Lophium mytilinum]|uniref:Uncharacterized protein n=1 Tax=Lophium mytilinum TaxID=390894 RepID=A0A6A6RBA7_9PEZI|nr:hypothetical protein BU16DRAFT_554062 [Lophium mytilinum]